MLRKMIYQRLTEEELDTFIDIRLKQLLEEGAKANIELRPALVDYYHKHLKDGTFISLLAI